MNDHNDIRAPRAEPVGEYTPGEYKEQARAFLRECLGEGKYCSIMSSAESRSLPHVAARVFLSDEQWAKYVWIERHGSLEGFSE